MRHLSFLACFFGRHPEESIIRLMVDHVMAANVMYDKYKFATKFSVQFVLAGFTIDMDTHCTADSIDFYADDQSSLEDDSLDYNPDYEYEYVHNDDNYTYSDVFDFFLQDDSQYDDDNWYPNLEYIEDDVYLNHDNCYEDIKGVVNVSTEFCKSFLPDEGPLYLNMFSTIDHSSFCLAHVWTYRKLEVLGLADTPTDGAPGLSGFCAVYDQECHIGFNTGLLSFQHHGAQLSLVDSQDTFIHELGHSLGAAHDPVDNSTCTPASNGRGGNYIMSQGPLGNAEVRRELSPCSVQAIDNVFQTVFENSCLLSWDDIVNDLQGGRVR